MRAIRLVLLALLIVALPATSLAGVFISVAIAPPLLPVYAQPLCPGPGYIWAPGYWAWGPFGYYWVPGAWVLPPFIGALWTPGYWDWDDGAYVWNAGFWGPYVGFYGGIDYGFGYFGTGFYGGYWNNGTFFYNTAVNNVNTTIVNNVYSQPVSNSMVSRVSFNGGNGGTTARPTATQMAAARARRDPPTATQNQLQRAASNNRGQWASVNHGRPAVAATARPQAFTRQAAAANRGGRNNAAMGGAGRRNGMAPLAGARPGAAARPMTGARPVTGARSMAQRARGNNAPMNRSIARAPVRQAPAVRGAPQRFNARNNVAARPAARNRAPMQYAAPRGRAQAYRPTAPATRYNARNNVPARPATRYRAPAQYAAPRARTQAYRPTAPAARYGARNVPVRPVMQNRAPAQRLNAPRSAPQPRFSAHSSPAPRFSAPRPSAPRFSAPRAAPSIPRAQSAPRPAAGPSRRGRG